MTTLETRPPKCEQFCVLYLQQKKKTNPCLKAWSGSAELAIDALPRAHLERPGSSVLGCALFEVAAFLALPGFVVAVPKVVHLAHHAIVLSGVWFTHTHTRTENKQD
jgi:hypothetical protein